MNKLNFLIEEYAIILSAFDVNTEPVFGKMNFHQMVEHMSYAFKQAAGLIPAEALHDDETTQKMHRFMMSDKAFKDNTPNPLLPDTPPAPNCEFVSDSISLLQKDIEHFVNVFEGNPNLRIQNPFFGNLNFDEWTHLLYKHALHHLRQFGFE